MGEKTSKPIWRKGDGLFQNFEISSTHTNLTPKKGRDAWSVGSTNTSRSERETQRQRETERGKIRQSAIIHPWCKRMNIECGDYCCKQSSWLVSAYPWRALSASLSSVYRCTHTNRPAGRGRVGTQLGSELLRVQQQQHLLLSFTDWSEWSSSSLEILRTGGKGWRF